MIHLKRQVKEVLQGVCAAVIYGEPRDAARSELIAWRESANRRYAQTDGQEYLAELNYTLEIYAPGAEGAAALLEAADAQMCSMGFRREAAVEQFEQEFNTSHISVRYRALADAQGNIYQ